MTTKESLNEATRLLRDAVYRGSVTDAARAIDLGASIDARDVMQLTPLHIAVNRGHIDIIRLLIDRGADVTIPDGDGHTPYRWAIEAHHTEVADLLQKASPETHRILQKRNLDRSPTGGGKLF